MQKKHIYRPFPMYCYIKMSFPMLSLIKSTLQYIIIVKQPSTFSYIFHPFQYICKVSFCNNMGLYFYGVILPRQADCLISPNHVLHSYTHHYFVFYKFCLFVYTKHFSSSFDTCCLYKNMCIKIFHVWNSFILKDINLQIHNSSCYRYYLYFQTSIGAIGKYPLRISGELLYFHSSQFG